MVELLLEEKIIKMLFQIGNVIITSEIISEYFCCDLEVCRGACCIEGDSGAPLTLEEVGELEKVLDEVWSDLSASAQAVIDKQGVAYTDVEGDLVTSIVGNKDCVFTCYDKEGCCYCSVEKKYREGHSNWIKPISCALYPIREKKFKNGLVGIQYSRWNICKSAIIKGKELHLPLYKFLREPLIRRFGKEWYGELCKVAENFEKEKNKVE